MVIGYRLLVIEEALEFVVVAVEAFATEVVVGALEDFTEDLVVLGDEEVVAGGKVGEDVFGQRTGGGEVGLSSTEGCAPDGSW